MTIQLYPRRWNTTEIRHFGFEESELNIFLKLCKDSKNLESFVSYTDSLFENNKEEFYHNLAVLKSAAFFTLRGGELEFIKCNSRTRVPDLKIMDKRGDIFYCEVKKRIRDEALDLFFKNLQKELSFHERGWRLAIDCGEPLLKYSLEKKRDKFSHILKAIKDCYSTKSAGNFEGLTWEFKKKPEGSKYSNFSISSPIKNQMKYWVDGEKVIEEAVSQIRSMGKFKAGFVILDLGNLFNRVYFCEYVQKKLIDKIVIIGLKSLYVFEFNYPRHVFTDDFIFCDK